MTTPFKKIVASAVLLCITGASVVLRVQPPPAGIWVGPYTYYWLMWAAVGGATALLILTIQFPKWPMPTWSQLTFGVILISAVITLLSHEWGLPYTSHDVWVQMGLAKYGILSPGENAYPHLHSLIISISVLLNVPISQLFVVGNTMIVSFTALAGTTVLRRLPASRRASQTAAVVAIPAWMTGLVVRPFSLAWSFVFVGFLLFMLQQSRVTSRIRLLWLVIGLLAPFIHPLLSIFLVMLCLSGWLVHFLYRFTNQWADMKIMSDAPPSADELPVLALLVVLAVSTFLVIYNLIFVESFVTTLGTFLLDAGANVEAGGTSATQTATTSIGALIEAITRLSYLLVSTAVVSVAMTIALRRRSLDYHQTVLFVLAGMLTTMFLAFDVILNAASLSIRRGIVIMPSILLLAGVRGFEVRRGVAIVLAIVVVTAGVGVTYPSGFTGQVGRTPTGSQVAGVEWLGENHGDATIDGGRSTFWIAEALFGKDQIRGWAGPPYNPKRVPKSQPANYPWTASQFDNELTVIDGESRAAARHSLTESNNRSGVVTLRQFRSTQSRIYANGGSNIYWTN